MKVIAVCMGLSFVAFLAMGLQMGLLNTGRLRGDDAVTAGEPDDAATKSKSKFPEDLAPAARAEAVKGAAEYKLGPRPHPMVFLKLNGELHSWQEGMREEWQAENVQSTELV